MMKTWQSGMEKWQTGHEKPEVDPSSIRRSIGQPQPFIWFLNYFYLNSFLNYLINYFL